MKSASAFFVVPAVAFVVLSGPGAALPGRDPGRPGPLNRGEVWVARYDGAAHSLDRAESVAVDSAGNVYVTGGSIAGSTGWDYATVKYSASGVKKWVRTYNFNTGTLGGSNVDYARALALDAAGNLYVTGESAEENGASRFATIKYTPLGGKAWVARTAFGTGLVESAAKALAVDGAGNILVTGWRKILESGSNTQQDIATVKITPAGAAAWTRTFNSVLGGADEGVAVGVDLAKNVYVAGFETVSLAGKNFRMLKYGPDGVVLWSRSYKGPGGSPDVASGLRIVLRRSGLKFLTELAVVGSSKASATGYDAVTTVLKSDGTSRWTRTFDGQGAAPNVRAKAVTSDTAGCLYVAAAGDCGGFFTLKYDASGNVVWLQSYNGGLGKDTPTAIALDSARNVYVTGLSQIGCNSYDYITIKYDAAGNHIWEKRYDGPSHGYDWAKAIAVDNKGYVYVTGQSEGSGTAEDYVTIKYTAD